jgi:hypothetical protein
MVGAFDAITGPSGQRELIYKFTCTRNNMSRCSCSVAQVRDCIHRESRLYKTNSMPKLTLS